ncbi:M56 family metallopeptidase [Robertkochia aurantiaca]|uniref:M56 family metallopeptidase n=1 Tax=Robertkochia aurantiaca TaxID=2873700 RepID=UPI001CC90B8C|nr:M56 family metallopeptidase [Robertkochia sp. 3YJGBD-33]
MIRYLIIMLSCQLLFLLVYDLWLKKETFFNWNRVYLLLTPLISVFLPFIKMDVLRTTAPEPLVKAVPVIFPEPAQVVTATVPQADGLSLTPWEWLLLSGGIIALGFFFYKLFLIFRLRQKGVKRYFKEYLQIEVADSEIAFSFFRQVFLGQRILERSHRHILDHELVHIREGHSWDLIYFEILRILFWFNPLVYVFQARMTELHEFIADEKMSGKHKKDTYEHLLQEVFHTREISFINSFFNHSLIKKRIIMLHRSRSNPLRKFKYLFIAPLVLGMLMYTSCEGEKPEIENSSVNAGEHLETSAESKGPGPAKDVAFSKIPVKPAFKSPCEDGQEAFACFRSKLDEHVIATFRYPAEALEKGMQGKVYVNFRINTDGSITVMETRAEHELLAQEGRRIIEALPELHPGGDEDGNPVPVTFAYPIIFKLKS